MPDMDRLKLIMDGIVTAHSLAKVREEYKKFALIVNDAALAGLKPSEVATGEDREFVEYLETNIRKREDERKE